MSANGRKKKRASFLGIGCGCKDSNSVSVSASGSSDNKSMTATPSGCRLARESSSGDTTTLMTSASSSSNFWEEEEAAKLNSSASTPSFSELLRQLNELERTLMALGASCAPQAATGDKELQEKKLQREHLRSSSEGAGGGGKVEECVPVVKQSDDPLGDFRRSMLQMIIEKEIVDGEELRELLRRFLALNSPRHHHLILRAFSEIWEEVFSGYEDTPVDVLRHRNNSTLPPPPPHPRPF